MEEFGQYTLTSQPPEVREGDRLVRLSPRQFAVLALLVKARGKMVSKQTFFEKVWHANFVEDGNLSQSIFLIRRALGKLPDGSEFIETIPGQGYRLNPFALRARNGASPGSFPSSELDPISAARFSEESHLRLLVDAIEDYAIYMMDCAGRVLTWNRGAEIRKGFTRREVVGRHYSMFFVPEDIEARIPDREISTASLSGRCSGEGWRLRKNGERFWATFVLTAVRNDAGKLLGFAKVVRDVSERKRQEDGLRRMEATLRRERDTLRAVAEISSDALCISEAVRSRDGEIEDFIFTYLNERVETMISIPRDVLLRGKMSEMLPLSRTLGVFDALKQVVLTGKPFVAEISIPEGEPTVLARRIRVSAVRLEDGVAIAASDLSKSVEAGEAGA